MPRRHEAPGGPARNTAAAWIGPAGRAAGAKQAETGLCNGNEIGASGASDGPG
jgi:hypothetical protein